MEFAEKLITLRKSRELTQEQLAEQLNVSRQSISKWESGQVIPEVEKIVELSKVFDVKEVEQRMSDLSLLMKHTTTYRQIKPIYEEYKKSPDKEKYLRGHESQIILFEAAAKALKEMQIKKLPNLAALRKEYDSLNDKKAALYEDYRKAKKQMQEYGVIKKNVDSILYPSKSRTREQER